MEAVVNAMQVVADETLNVASVASEPLKASKPRLLRQLSSHGLPGDPGQATRALALPRATRRADARVRVAVPDKSLAVGILCGPRARENGGCNDSALIDLEVAPKRLRVTPTAEAEPAPAEVCFDEMDDTFWMGLLSGSEGARANVVEMSTDDDQGAEAETAVAAAAAALPAAEVEAALPAAGGDAAVAPAARPPPISIAAAASPDCVTGSPSSGSSASPRRAVIDLMLAARVRAVAASVADKPAAPAADEPAAPEDDAISDEGEPPPPRPPAVKGKRGAKPVEQVDPATGAVVGHFSSGMEASHKTGVSNVAISQVCNGRTALAGGFSWRFAETRPDTPGGRSPEPGVGKAGLKERACGFVRSLESGVS